MRLIFNIILIWALGLTLTYANEGHHMMREASKVQQNLGICPVIHEPASKEYSYTYEGKTYYFCCPMCIEEFKKEPQKYITKIKEFNLEAYQFGFSPEVIEVKKGDIAKILAISRDVPHGVYIEEYNINVPVKKDQTQRIEFVADKNGEFDILCSIYCGKGHNTMKAMLVVKE
ncbi:MAG: hypothetical protein COX40_05190 [Candidatus Omnitrophica bacterium CG23_combo_of_CG06-09_8_20_14_all_40_11]|nr:MAG: hypothetical protein COX40_05190 [Candidatus Omnitrophica bacterium CG23_combo_of_CG06-09_8_20_14_all_40_11]